MLTQEIEKVLEELTHRHCQNCNGGTHPISPIQDEMNIDQATLALLELFKKVLPSEEEIRNIGIDLVEEFFPKGECKERGQAIVLYAQLIIKFEQALKEIKERMG